MFKKLSLIMLIGIMLTGCSKTVSLDEKNSEEPKIVQTVEVEENAEEIEEVEVLDPKEQIDLALNPNESGKVMVLMYHSVGPEEAEWSRTPENLRKDLLTLYEKGYRPIRLNDYVSGNITTPAGFTPVVITFDDGNKNNFEYLEDNTIDENSAISILLDFGKEYPDFNPTATFFLNGDVPFGQSERIVEKIKFLIDNGMDVGNHSRTHANFTKITKEDLQKEIGGQAQHIESFIQDKSYKVDTIALPFGSRPKDESLTPFLKQGNYEGVDYNNVAILNVGWNPAHSPYDSRFNFESIPRIRASEMKVDNVGMYNYIQYFDNNPTERFISDGFPEIITVPEGKLELINPELEKEIYVYE